MEARRLKRKHASVKNLGAPPPLPLDESTAQIRPLPAASTAVASLLKKRFSLHH